VLRVPPSSKDIVDFYYKFGPSAGLAYTHAVNTVTFECNLRRRLGDIHIVLETLLTQASSAFLSDDISHMLFLLSPHEFYLDFQVSIPTRSISNLLQVHAQKTNEQQLVKLFTIFLRHPYTMSCAGYILDGRIHKLLSNGVRWTVSWMACKSKQGPKNWHLQDSDETSQMYIGLDGQGAVINSAALQGDYTNLPVHLYRPSMEIKLCSVYYWPACHSQETFNAFIYNELTQTAFALQVTVSKEHSFKPLGFNYLESLGCLYCCFTL
jgi:hypothetical protein